MKPQQLAPQMIGGTVDTCSASEKLQPTSFALAAAAADRTASSAVFAEYREQLAPHTRAAHDHDLARYALYLADAGTEVGALALEPAAWSAFSWGLAEGFKRWMLREGYAIATINRALATLKSYTRLAAQDGALAADQAALIASVRGYGRKQARNLDAGRATTRRSSKKAQAVTLSLATPARSRTSPATRRRAGATNCCSACCSTTACA